MANPQDRWFNYALLPSLLAAGACLLTIAGGSLVMRPAVYPFLLWGGAFALTASIVPAIGMLAWRSVRKSQDPTRYRQSGRPLQGRSTEMSPTFGELGLFLVPGVIAGLGVLLLLRLNLFGYAE